MHPVIQHILERKGKSVPVEDGRKIALVLLGGMMWGVRGMGSVAALEELRLSHAFDYIYSASAGFLNASCLLAGDVQKGGSIYCNELSDKKFINFLRPWNIVDVDYLNSCIKNRFGQEGIESIWQTKTRLYIRVQNSKRRRPKYIEIHDYVPQDFFNLAKAATAVPILHPQGVKLKKLYCQDGEFTDKDHMQEIHYALASQATDLLIIYNHLNQKLVNVPLGEIFNFDHPDRVYEIYPDEDWKLSRFETNPAKLKEAYIQMQNKVAKEFGQSVGDEKTEHVFGPGPEEGAPRLA